jgi:phosphomannomutase
VTDAAAISAAIEGEYGAKDGVTVDHLDGLTVDGGSWWFNLRASNTEPLLRLNVEAQSQGEMERLRDELLGKIRS